ncbi:hypothetical protein ALCH109712_08705 [Alkalicoccus chagannorensis]
MLSFVVDFIRFRRTLAQGLVLHDPSRSEGGFSDCAYPLSVAAYRYFHQITTSSFNSAFIKNRKSFLFGIRSDALLPPDAFRRGLSQLVCLRQPDLRIVLILSESPAARRPCSKKSCNTFSQRLRMYKFSYKKAVAVSASKNKRLFSVNVIRSELHFLLQRGGRCCVVAGFRCESTGLRAYLDVPLPSCGGVGAFWRAFSPGRRPFAAGRRG